MLENTTKLKKIEVKSDPDLADEGNNNIIKETESVSLKTELERKTSLCTMLK
jgi:hypothetical protein